MAKLIAEFCQNHNGDFDLLKKMVEAAAIAGATHGKMQTNTIRTTQHTSQNTEKHYYTTANLKKHYKNLKKQEKQTNTAPKYTTTQHQHTSDKTVSKMP